MSFPELPKGYSWQVRVRNRSFLGDTVYVKVVGRIFVHATAHSIWSFAEEKGWEYGELLEHLAKVAHQSFLADRAEPIEKARRREAARRYQNELNEAAHS